MLTSGWIHACSKPKTVCPRILKTVMAMANRRNPPRRLVAFAVAGAVIGCSFPVKPTELCASPESGLEFGDEWFHSRRARKDQQQPLSTWAAAPGQSAIPGCAFPNDHC